MTSSRFGRATRGQKPKDTELELDVIIGVMISLDWCAQNAVVQYFMCECGSASASTGRYILYCRCSKQLREKQRVHSNYIPVRRISRPGQIIDFQLMI